MLAFLRVQVTGIIKLVFNYFSALHIQHLFASGSMSIGECSPRRLKHKHTDAIVRVHTHMQP